MQTTKDRVEGRNPGFATFEIGFRFAWHILISDPDDSDEVWLHTSSTGMCSLKDTDEDLRW